MRSHPRAVAADWEAGVDLCRIPASFAAVEADIKLGPGSPPSNAKRTLALRAIPGRGASTRRHVRLRNSFGHVWTAVVGHAAESAIPVHAGTPQRGAPAPVGYRVCWCIAIPAIVLFDEHLPCASEGHKTLYRLLHMSNSRALRLYSVGLLWYGKRTTKPVSHML